MTRLPDLTVAESVFDYADGKDEVQFVDRLLEAWMWDSRNTGLPRLEPHCTLGRYVKATDESAPPVAVSVLDLNDAQFMAIDRAVVRLPRALHRIIWIEYASPAPQRAKARRMHLSYADYRGRLLAARWSVYAALLPAVDRWRALIARRVENVLDPVNREV